MLVLKKKESAFLKSEEPLSETSKAINQKSDNLKKSSQDSIDEMGLLLREVIRNNPTFTPEKIWRELKRETGRKNKNFDG